MRLLSYNVEGLPWPLTHGRTQAAEEIGRQLRQVSARGQRPHVLALQEAFGGAQEMIGEEAGYRYAAFGPAAGMVSLEAATGAERTFLAQASILRGETEGAQEDSGLAIFSDYPIVATWRVPFPRFACAGYDCLANKGMLAVALRVPGRTAPLIVVDTHLNSRTASGVADDRSFAAYAQQVDLLGRTVRGFAGSGAQVLLAGDFNVGNDSARASYLAQSLVARDGLKVAAAELACGATCRDLATTPTIAHAKTIVLYGGPVAAYRSPRRFGQLPGGQRLSDHLGIIQAFRLR
ncbi:endonuclease/exonuclease/phosphatase family protein [Sphingomonas sp. DT-51]|uniref:endonuclease/exonuclease/phosphatase family protein n=1 Tax=Sphingomonas sp. DT-51 TaxID=3396165 RepID=UPI003F541FF5